MRKDDDDWALEHADESDDSLPPLEPDEVEIVATVKQKKRRKRLKRLSEVKSSRNALQKQRKFGQNKSSQMASRSHSEKSSSSQQRPKLMQPSSWKVHNPHAQKRKRIVSKEEEERKRQERKKKKISFLERMRLKNQRRAAMKVMQIADNVSKSSSTSKAEIVPKSRPALQIARARSIANASRKTGPVSVFVSAGAQRINNNKPNFSMQKRSRPVQVQKKKINMNILNDLKTTSKQSRTTKQPLKPSNIVDLTRNAPMEIEYLEKAPNMTSKAIVKPKRLNHLKKLPTIPKNTQSIPKRSNYETKTQNVRRNYGSTKNETHESERDLAKAEFLQEVLTWDLKKPSTPPPEVTLRVRLYTEQTKQEKREENSSRPFPRKVSCFDNPESYRKVFRPLLLENFRAELDSELEACTKESVVNMMKVVDLNVCKWNQLVTAKLRHDGAKNRRLENILKDTQGHIGIICLGSFNFNAKNKNKHKPSKSLNPHQRAADFAKATIPSCYALCLINNVSWGQLEVRVQMALPLPKKDMPMSQSAKILTENSIRLEKIRDMLMGAEKEKKSNLSFNILPLTHMTTTMREFVALSFLESIPLLLPLLNPTTNILSNDTSKIALTAAYGQRLESILNPSQMQALLAAVEGRPFTLLQGPPGTGKTRTAVEVLNSLHLNKFQEYYSSLSNKAWERVRLMSYRAEKRRLERTHPGLISNTEKPVIYQSKNASLSDILQSIDQKSSEDIVISRKPHILVCAPSNAAVDELVRRVLNQGFKDGENKEYRPDILRIGTRKAAETKSTAWETISLSVRVAAIMTLGAVKAKEMVKQANIDISGLRAKKANLEKLAKQFMEWHNGEVLKRENIFPHQLGEKRWGKIELPQTDSNYKQIAELKMHLTQLHEQLRAAQLYIQRHHWLAQLKTGKEGFRTPDSIRNMLESSMLDEAQIVFCTLSTAGSQIVLNHARKPWDYVLIDEAAQSVELSTLVALQHRVSRCILIGDPQQLPATVNITSGNARLYQQSLFERLMRAGHQVMMLNTQYRMHPLISAFPSRHFYKARLMDGGNVRSAAWTKPYHSDRRYKPLMFFNVRSSHKLDNRTHSAYNDAEATFAVALLEGFVRYWGERESKMHGRTMSVGVITPYSAQRRRLENRLSQIRKRDKSWNNVSLKVATVDGFQGGEKDVIVFSCVRSGGRSGIGFLADIRRMNVALTRARYACWVVGDAFALDQNHHWGAFIRHCRTTGAIYDVSSQYKTEFL